MKVIKGNEEIWQGNEEIWLYYLQNRPIFAANADFCRKVVKVMKVSLYMGGGVEPYPPPPVYVRIFITFITFRPLENVRAVFKVVKAIFLHYLLVVKGIKR